MEDAAKIIWASPQTLARDGIVALLSQEPDFTFAEIVSRREDIATALLGAPDCNLLVIDHVFLGDDPSYLFMLKQTMAILKVLVLSGIDHNEDIRRLVKSGAAGYIV